MREDIQIYEFHHSYEALVFYAEAPQPHGTHFSRAT